MYCRPSPSSCHLLKETLQKTLTPKSQLWNSWKSFLITRRREHRKSRSYLTWGLYLVLSSKWHWARLWKWIFQIGAVSYRTKISLDLQRKTYIHTSGQAGSRFRLRSRLIHSASALTGVFSNQSKEAEGFNILQYHKCSPHLFMWSGWTKGSQADYRLVHPKLHFVRKIQVMFPKCRSQSSTLLYCWSDPFHGIF